MCPFVWLTVLLSFLMFLVELTAAITVKFYPSQLNETILEGDTQRVYASIEDPGHRINESIYNVVSDDPDIADVKNQTYFLNEAGNVLNVSFLVKGNFLGITKLRVVPLEFQNKEDLKFSSPTLDVKIRKKERAITRAFTIFVAVVMSFNFVNMGCALDLTVVKSVLKKPIAPCMGFFCQYGFMPLIAYGLTRLLFTDVVLQLGLFTYACSPGGGASNMWTVFLKGNLNLSLTMTLISNLAAFGMMPLWFFTLGHTLFSEINTKVPYVNMFQFLGIMLVTLAIGLAFQKYLPRVAKFVSRMLAPVSAIMILSIIVFGTYANLYMFRLFTWRIIFAVTINVWLGFLFGAIASKIFNLPLEDIIAISVETGIQNTGIAYVMLQISLLEPEKDLASVVPIAGSIMTPIPLLFVFCMQVLWKRWFKKSQKEQAYILSNDEEKRALPMPRSTDPIIPISNGYSH